MAGDSGLNSRNYYFVNGFCLNAGYALSRFNSNYFYGNGHWKHDEDQVKNQEL